MKYTIEMMVQKNREACIDGYLNPKHMMTWQTHLKNLENVQGSWLEPQSVYMMHFDFGAHQMHMKLTTQENQLPDSIHLIYEVTGAWNLCINHFKDLGNQTLWTMEVEFKFEVDPQLDINIFKQKTTESMDIFKQYMEQQYT